MAGLTLPTVESCYFCDIVTGKAGGWNLLTEGQLTVTLLNGRQFETGQSIICPKRHAPTLLDLSAAESAEIMAAAQRLSGLLLDEHDAEGILLYQNNGVASGQEVPHFHLHVVPRRAGSDWGLGPPHIERLEHEGRASRFDHRAATAEKRTTVEELRASFGRAPAP